MLTEHIPEYLNQTQTEIQIEGEQIHINPLTIKNAIKQLKNDKSPDPGGINAELLKYGTDELYMYISSLYMYLQNVVMEKIYLKSGKQHTLFQYTRKELR